MPYQTCVHGKCLTQCTIAPFQHICSACPTQTSHPIEIGGKAEGIEPWFPPVLRVQLWGLKGDDVVKV